MVWACAYHSQSQSLLFLIFIFRFSNDFALVCWLHCSYLLSMYAETYKHQSDYYVCPIFISSDLVFCLCGHADALCQAVPHARSRYCGRSIAVAADGKLVVLEVRRATLPFQSFASHSNSPLSSFQTNLCLFE